MNTPSQQGVAVSIIQRAVPETAQPLHENAMVSRVLSARGVQSASEMNFTLSDLPTPDTLLGIDQAVERLAQALQAQEKVLVVGDYDCDGATSTALAVLGFKAMGFEHVEFLVPNRFEYGYGLSPAIVDVAKQQNPALIFTVDNGVASVDGVERASELGMDVIVTDHHLPPALLPRAVAIVNPNIPGATFPSKHLAGVGVCFYVLSALRAHLHKAGLLKQELKMAQFLDLVAIGTVADVVPLDHINRTLVEQGLRRIRAGVTRKGVLALLARAGRVATRTSSDDIGFALGPRLNAAGRLDDMTRGISCLLTEDDLTAHNLATELDSLNQQRRSIESTMRAEAEAILENETDALHANTKRFSIVLFKDSWHQGVIGIVAGRVKEQLNKPVVVFAQDSDTLIKGSARSIPGVHIRDVLDAVATNNPDLIHKFGGHAMAAGLTLAKSRFSEFAEAFEAEVKRVLDGELPNREWVTDGSLSDNERTLTNAQLLTDLSPWGQEFPAPLFDDVFTISSAREVGKGHLKLSLVSQSGSESKQGQRYDAIAFNQPDIFTIGDAVQVVYSLSVNHYRGNLSLQLQVKYMQLSGQ
jgi:single-stranded-DNA-specific exonuclease